MSLLSDTLVFIRHHQDGEIAEKIRNSGLGYNMNYGVSSMLLANYAKKTGRNRQVPTEIFPFTRTIRTTKSKANNENIK